MSQGMRAPNAIRVFHSIADSILAAAVMKDEQGRPFIVVREYVSKGRNRSSSIASAAISKKRLYGPRLTATQSGEKEKATRQ
jgi:hypothetical protein